MAGTIAKTLMTMNNDMKHQRAKGFTLVEVMVALVIVGLALPALITQVLSVMDASTTRRDQTVAHWVAENRYTRLRLQQSLTGTLLQGEATGTEEQGGHLWHWKVESETTEMDGLRRLTISAGRDKDQPLIQQDWFLHE